MSVWFITGASRGFGIEIVREALSRGDHVIATARRPESITQRFPNAGDALLALPLDVTDAASVAVAVDRGTARFGRIDVLVNNAGRGLLGAIEEASDAEVRAVFEVNVFGLLTVTRGVLPVLRQQRSGTIINISSVAGFVSRPGWGVYASTKFAVEAISEGLGKELAPLGVRVVAVEPGAFRTNFLDSSSLVAAESSIHDYADTAGATRRWAADTNNAQDGDPERAAAVIVDLAHRDTVPERLQLGADSFAAVAAKVALVAREQAEWNDVSHSTAITDVQGPA
ncbi:NADP-dependent 3-hydroxy acid dehydrogenase YdfG [Rathayibacter oskolensis]|uniref:NADP-dependent 3-hydroxy acid dehydrogenase YdfG n=1 Tax=Rathayibacter oskolensis TaxID=1891671 RepID=A0A1X7P259_9MICO|nr:oxidoreductase [Rathayibacter oskolensis]SMH43996.1 NADP-dependent 3-hydroxy acid dehydrogenase YdfG [Rathayibacter oskolensis]